MVTAPAPGEIINGTFTGALNTALGVWTDYSTSFAFTAATTNPTKGNSTYQAKYWQFGQTVNYTFKVTIGSTFAAGSGAYNFSVPVTAKADRVAVGTVWINASGTALKLGVATFNNNTTQLQVFHYNSAANGGLVILDSSGPGRAWVANDAFMVSITYEAA